MSDSRLSCLSLIAVERELSDKLLKDSRIHQKLLTSLRFAAIDALVCCCNQCDVCAVL